MESNKKAKRLRRTIPKNPKNIRQQDKVQLKRWRNQHLQNVHAICNKLFQRVNILIALSEGVVEGH